MSRRQDLIEKIQALSLDEGTRQPAAAVWLADQDEKARLRRSRDPGRESGHDYQDDLPGGEPEA